MSTINVGDLEVTIGGSVSPTLEAAVKSTTKRLTILGKDANHVQQQVESLLRACGVQAPVSVKKLGSSLSSAGKDAQKAANSFRIMSSSAEDMARKLANAQKTVRSMSSALSDFYNAYRGVGTFVATPLKNILDTTGEFEKMNQLLKGLSKHTSEFGKSLDASFDQDFIINMAKKAPFDIKAIQDAFVKFRVGGLDPANGSLQALIDSVAAFGGSSDEIHRASIAIQQMYGKGAISMEELRQQLGEAIPDAMKALAEVMTGGNMAEMTKRIATGQESAAKWVPLMLEKLGEWHKGSAEKMMGTWSGMLSQMRTEWDLFQKQLGESGFMDGAKQSVRELTQAFKDESTFATAKTIGKDLSLVVGALTDAVKVALEFKDIIVAIGEVYAITKLGSWLKEGISTANKWGRSQINTPMIDEETGKQIRDGRGQPVYNQGSSFFARAQTRYRDDIFNQQDKIKQQGLDLVREREKIAQENLEIANKDAETVEREYQNAQRRFEATELSIQASQRQLDAMSRIASRKEAYADNADYFIAHGYQQQYNSLGLNFDAQKQAIESQIQLLEQKKALARQETTQLQTEYLEKERLVKEGEAQLELLRKKALEKRAVADANPNNAMAGALAKQAESEVAKQEAVIAGLQQEVDARLALYQARAEDLAIIEQSLVQQTEAHNILIQQYNEEIAKLNELLALKTQTSARLRQEAADVRSQIAVHEQQNVVTMQGAQADIQAAEAKHKKAIASVTAKTAMLEDAQATLQTGIASDATTIKINGLARALAMLRAAYREAAVGARELGASMFGAEGLRGMLKGFGMMAVQMIAFELAIKGASLAWNFFKQSVNDFNGTTAQRVKDNLGQIKNGLNQGEAYEEFIRYRQVLTEKIQTERTAIDDLNDGMSEYNNTLQETLANENDLIQAKKELEKLNEADKINSKNAEARELVKAQKEAAQEYKNAMKELQDALASGESEEKLTQMQIAVDEKRIALAKSMESSAKFMHENYKFITDENVRLMRDEAQKSYELYKRLGEWFSNLLSNAVRTDIGNWITKAKNAVSGWFGSGDEGGKAIENGVKIFNKTSALSGLADIGKSAMPKPQSGGTGKGGSKKNKKKSGSGGSKRDTYGDLIANLKSQNAKLEVENQSLIANVETTEDVIAKATAIVQGKLGKDGKNKNLKPAIELEEKALRLEAANKLLKSSTDALAKSDEEIIIAEAELAGGYDNLSSGVESLLKKWAVEERQLKIVGEEYKKAIEQKRAMALASRVEADALMELKKIQEGNKDLDIKQIKDTAERRKAEAERAKNDEKAKHETILKELKDRKVKEHLTAEKYNKMMEAENKRHTEQLAYDQRRLAEEHKTAIQSMSDDWMDVTKNMEEASKGWASSLADNFQTMLEGGQVNWRQFLAGMLSDINKIIIQRMMANTINPLIDGMQSGIAGGINAMFNQGNNGNNKQENQQNQFLDNLIAGAKDFGDSIKNFASESFTYMSDIFTRLGGGLTDMLSNMGSWISQIFSSMGSGGSGGAGFFGSIASMFSFAKGGVMSGAGSLSLKKYANGGIANSPHLALFGEGSKPEAFVPLPDGRSIPVTMTGGQNMGGSYTPVSIQINVENNGDTKSESSSSNNDQNKMWGNLAQRIKGMVVEEIATQKRPGGVLYAK